MANIDEDFSYFSNTLSTTPTTINTQSIPSTIENVTDDSGSVWSVTICNNQLFMNNNDGNTPLHQNHQPPPPPPPQPSHQHHRQQQLVAQLIHKQTPPTPQNAPASAIAFIMEELQREKTEIIKLYNMINIKEQKTMALVSLLNKYC